MKKSLFLTQTVLASTFFGMGQALADVTVTGLNTPPPGSPPSYQTSVDGNIEVAPTGLINPPIGDDGVIIDSSSATLIIDANNVSSKAPYAIVTGGSGVPINVVAGGNSATVTINIGSGINTEGGADAIQVADTLFTIMNQGTIDGTNTGIKLFSTGTSATINNQGGTIIAHGGAGEAAIVADAGGSGLIVINSSSTTTPSVGGLIQGSSDGILINSSFTSITNNAGSTIKSFNGAGIHINSPATGDIQNFGLIGTGIYGIEVEAAYNGSITNNVGGEITGIFEGLYLHASFNEVNNNAGATISATTAGSGAAILIENSAPGTINNAGTVEIDNATSAVLIKGSSTALINSGTIIATNPDVATISGDGSLVLSTLSDGIFNTGIIVSGSAKPAIDFQTKAGANGIDIPLFQQGGAIIGDVLLSYNGGDVLTMTGGVIQGDVTSSSANASTLFLAGGVIEGVTQLGNINGNIVNLSGTTLTQLIGGTGNDTYNISGGSFTSLEGNGGADVANVIASFTLNGTISDVPTINVNNSGTVFTVNNTISDINTQLTISNGATMIAAAGIGGVSGTGLLSLQNGGKLQINSGSTVDMGTANNAGFLAIANNAALNISGAYTQSKVFAPTIADMTANGFGVINVGTTATFNPGSTFNPQLTSDTFLLNNFVFPVVQTAGGVVGFNNITVVQPPSAIVSFTKNLNGNNVELISHTLPLSLVAEPDIPLAIAATLDGLIPTTLAQILTTNPEILALLGELQRFTTVQEISAALLQLAPPFNYALPTSSRVSMDNAFDSVHARLESMTKIGLIVQDESYHEHRDYELYNGVNYGDRNVVTLGSGVFGAWIKAYGSIIDQHKRHYIEGFQSDVAGLAVGGDWNLNNFATIGIGQSYTKVNTTDNTDQRNTVNVKSNQTTFYGWFVPFDVCQENARQTIYMELMLALATHKYDTTRNIAIGNINASAMATFYGWHYGAQSDIGYAFISSDNYLVAPLARFRYTYLDIGNYSETGAGGLNLSVINDDLDEAVAGLGIRLAWVKNFIQAVYVPEVSVVLLYDFAGRVQESQSNFLGGGEPFYTNSIKPAQYIQQYSAGITAYTSDGYAFTIKGNFEHRDHFFVYNGYMQLNYEWD
ncbi:MAG: autotransporter domain-containing protein [Proteobacteria bacterium]|nr:autotransporter domain-containing protein [Pseudomonadota bacterium]